MNITPRIAAELIAHEGLVYEAYRDVRNIWTWGVGITSSSGHKVWPRYVDNPQTLDKCLKIYEWALRKNYLPKVKSTFAKHTLTEEQLGAALSFHYNTGRIHTATWVKQWKRGEVAEAKVSIMNWSTPSSIIPRRKKERALFFDGTWSGDGKTLQFKVLKPSYKPRANGRIDVTDALADIFS